MGVSNYIWQSDLLDSFYLTGLFLNVRTLRESRGLNTPDSIYRAFLKTLIKYAFAGFSSVVCVVETQVLLDNPSSITQLLCIDTDPKIQEFCNDLFNSFSFIKLVSIDLSEFDYATDASGRKPHLLNSEISLAIKDKLKEHGKSYFTTNLDADDIISPIHNLLIQKHRHCSNLKAGEENSVEKYLCFPQGSQYSIENHQFFIYWYIKLFISLSTLKSDLPHMVNRSRYT